MKTVQKKEKAAGLKEKLETLEQKIAGKPSPAKVEVRQLAQFSLQLGSQFFDQKAYLEANVYFQKSLEAAQTAEDSAGQAAALLGMGRTALELEAFELATDWLSRGWELSRRQKDLAEEWEYLVLLARAGLAMRQPDRALRFLPSLDKEVDKDLYCRVIGDLTDLSVRSVAQGAFSTAFSFWEAGMKLRCSIGAEPVKKSRLNWLRQFGQLFREWGNLEVCKENYTLASRYYDLSLKMYERIRDRDNQRSMYELLTTLQHRRGFKLSEFALRMMDDPPERRPAGEESLLIDFLPDYHLTVTDVQLTDAVWKEKDVFVGVGKIAFRNDGNFDWPGVRPVTIEVDKGYESPDGKMTGSGNGFSISVPLDRLAPGTVYTHQTVLLNIWAEKKNYRYYPRLSSTDPLLRFSLASLGYGTYKSKSSYLRIDKEGDFDIVSKGSASGKANRKGTKLQKVFISYNHANWEVVRKLLDMLEKENISTIIDRRDFKRGQDLFRSIEQAIRHSGYTLLIISKDSLSSTWVALETIHALDYAQKYARRLLPCYLDTKYMEWDYASELLSLVEQQMAETEKKIERRKEKGRDRRDLEAELAKHKRLYENLDNILAELRSTKCLDIRGDKLQENFGKILEAIREN